MKWIVVLGVAGFAAGFFGPIIFVPEANQGPLVGIFISGPAGVLIGLALFGVCSLLKVAPRTQWRLLLGTGVAGVLVTLLAVQPAPALRGRLYEAAVESCSRPIDTEAAVLRDWGERIARVTWAAPRGGWQRDMHAVLSSAPGVVVVVRVAKQNAVLENRKPWNRGVITSEGWRPGTQAKSFYIASASCAEYPVGLGLRGFDRYDVPERIEPPKDWPPNDLESVLDAAVWQPVPADYARF
jgi:hypothetical protein